MEFEWSEAKGRENRRRHGVAFVEAVTAFQDPFALYLSDSRHAEQRFVLLGMSARERILFVVHAERRGGAIRIISARLATRKERGKYAEGHEH